MLEYSDPVSSHDEDGASAVEYGLLISGIAAIVVAVIFLFGGMVAGVFDDTCIAVDTGSNNAMSCEGP
jgi:pilus assembly protein Flp/PilA